MLSSSLTNLVAEGRVQDLHRAARNDGRARRISATARQVDHSPAAALVARVTRAITRVFDGARSADDDAAALHEFGLLAHSSAATWSRRS